MNAEQALEAVDVALGKVGGGAYVREDLREARAYFAELVRREAAMQSAIEKVCRLMQGNIDGGTRPDQWIMRGMQWTLRDAANTPPQEPQT
jgi:hypothetical protein